MEQIGTKQTKESPYGCMQCSDAGLNRLAVQRCEGGNLDFPPHLDTYNSSWTPNPGSTETRGHRRANSSGKRYVTGRNGTETTLYSSKNIKEEKETYISH